MGSNHSPAIEASPHQTVSPLNQDASGPPRSETQRAIALGVLLDGRIQEGWVLACLRQALAVPGVRLAAIAIARAGPRASVATRLHRLLDWIDRQLRCRNEPLFAPADVAAELAAPLVEIVTGSSGDGWYPTESGLAALRRRGADLWLCFGATRPRRPFPAVARYGVWGLEIGRDIPAAQHWAGANEIGGGSPVTMVSVVDYAAPGDGVLLRTLGATVGNSVRRNRLACLRKGTGSFKPLLEGLTRNEFPRRAQAGVPARYPAQREPTVSALARLSWRLASKVAANRLSALRGPLQWQMAYYFDDEHEAGHRFERLRYLVPPKDRAWADPFAL